MRDLQAIIHQLSNSLKRLFPELHPVYRPDRIAIRLLCSLAEHRRTTAPNDTRQSPSQSQPAAFEAFAVAARGLHILPRVQEVGFAARRSHLRLQQVDSSLAASARTAWGPAAHVRVRTTWIDLVSWVQANYQDDWTAHNQEWERRGSILSLPISFCETWIK